MTSSGTTRTIVARLATLVGSISLLVACSDASAPLLGEAVSADSESDDDDCDVRDSLFVGDRGLPPLFRDSVERFDADTGAYRGSFIQPNFGLNNGLLNGPSALLFNKRGNGNAELLVVSQNVHNVPFDLSSAVLRYDAEDGHFLGTLVAAAPFPQDPRPPFAARGMVIRGNVLYIADLGDTGLAAPSRVARFDEQTGAVLGDLVLSSTSCFPRDLVFGCFPRDLVFGPDGYLYVTAVPVDGSDGGSIVRFDPDTGTQDVVVKYPDINRPGPPVFGPDGRLYAVSKGLTSDALNQTRIFDVHDGQGSLFAQFDLAPFLLGVPQSPVAAMIFGPGGDLFISFPTIGAVRRYDVHDLLHVTFTDFVKPPAEGGELIFPVYLTFRNTDPATLAYKPKGKHCPSP